MAKEYYICSNQWGDPCEYAVANKKIPVDEVSKSLGGEAAKCPGKTQSGKTCESDLEFISGGKSFTFNPKLLLAIVAGVVVLATIGVLLFKFISSPDDAAVTAPPTPQSTQVSSDPWKVYKELESTSTILRTKPE